MITALITLLAIGGVFVVLMVFVNSAARTKAKRPSPRTNRSGDTDASFLAILLPTFFAANSSDSSNPAHPHPPHPAPDAPATDCHHGSDAGQCHGGSDAGGSTADCSGGGGDGGGGGGGD